MDSEFSCELSPQARAFSTVLTAFVGSIVNGATSGGIVAFVTGWISWLAVLRQPSTSQPADEILMEERVLIPDTSQGGTHGASQDGMTTGLSAVLKLQSNMAERVNNRLKREITVLGWIGWLYTAIYSPIVQALWLAEKRTASGGSLKITRAIGISISALSLTIDIKKRYASRLSDIKFLGSPACVAFKIVNAGSAFGMGIMCAALLVKGAIDLGLAWYIIIIYCVGLVIWAAASFRICPVQDCGIKGWGIVPDVLMGAFAGIFLAVPAFAVMQSAEQPTPFSTPESGQASLREYLSCDSVAVGQKFVAIFP
ncbi:hypothetical protein BDR22DRAFT_959025 [Usnea florida]